MSSQPQKTHDSLSKLAFRIHATSGEDPDYPARELLSHSPHTRGWQSARFCQYPQEVILRLERSSHLRQVQILTHEYKIATRAELSVAMADDGAAFKRLGHLSFDSNEKSGHQARELKSVHVSTDALLLKITLHRCHVNRLNIYNQVGLVAINLLGEPGTQGAGVGGAYSVGASDVPAPNFAVPSKGNAGVSDLVLDVNVDAGTLALLRDINAQKEAAVASEAYEEAKRLKAVMERLKVLGHRIARLEAQKAAAVQAEDYDAAKLVKVDVDKLRAACAQALHAKPGDAAGGAMAKTTGWADVAVPDGPMGGAGGGAQQGQARPRAALSKDPEEIFNRVLAPKKGAAGSAPPQPAQDEEVDHDEVPVTAAAAAADGEGYDPGEYAEGGDGEPADGAADGAEQGPNGLPAPEPLASSDAKEAEGIVTVAGEEVARCLYSRNWQLREHSHATLEAMASGSEQFANGTAPDDAFRHLVRVACARGLNDKVSNVFHASTKLLTACVTQLAASGGLGKSDIRHALHDVVPLLAGRCGDAHARTRECATDCLATIALAENAGFQCVSEALLKSPKSQGNWRPVLSRLAVLERVAPQCGFHEGLEKSGEIGLERYMAFVGEALSHANGDVRQAAMRCARLARSACGTRAVERLLPPGLKPSQKDALLGTGDGGEVDAENESGRANDTETSVAPSAAPKPKPKPKPKPAPKPAPAEPVAASAGGGAGDISAARAELRRAEEAHGKDDPEVAQCLVDLAVLVTESGDPTEASSLYERALPILEQESDSKPEGSEASLVSRDQLAQVLTDLAVLHIESGADDQGRPLLERALTIRQRDLGPEHEDAKAIEDVLANLNS